MKDLLNKLNALTSLLESTIEARNEKFDNASERWQESEKGEDYLMLTESLELFQETVNELIEEIEDL